MRTFLFVSLLLTVYSASGQMISLRDSLAESFAQTPRLAAHLDSRHSLVSGRGARFQGIKAGFAFGEQVELGIGYNWLASHQQLPTIEEAIQEEPRFRYVAPYMIFRFRFQERWRISCPVQLGIGQSFVLRDDPESGESREAFGTSVIYEPGMQAEYLFLKYFRIGAGIGYRLMLVNNREINYNFTAPTFSMLLGADFGKIIQDLKASEHD